MKFINNTGNNRVIDSIRPWLQSRSQLDIASAHYSLFAFAELAAHVAHQDYVLGGKINVVEHPDRLVFGNLGEFLAPNVEWMLAHQSPPEHYRNQWLINGMIRLRMIDRLGSGIRRMFDKQRKRFSQCLIL